MNKKQKEYFNKLFKVGILQDVLKIEEEEGWDGRVTRQSKHDIKRTLKFIEYGFKEGIKFVKEGKREESKTQLNKNGGKK